MKHMETLSLLLLVAVPATLAQTNCGGTFSDSTLKKSFKYDLSMMYHKPGELDTMKYQDADRNTYYVNICGESSLSCSTGTTSCERGSDYRYYSLGMLDTQKITPCTLSSQAFGTGVTISYSGGDACPMSAGRRSSQYHVLCKKGAIPGYIDSASETDCLWTFKVWSESACGTEVPFGPTPASGSEGPKPKPGKGKLGAGWVIFILLLVAVVLYFAVGVVVQWKVRHMSGREMIPNSAFWFGLPGLVKDGAMFIAHGFKKDRYSTV